MANTAVKNDTTAVTRSILVVSRNKEEKEAENRAIKKVAERLNREESAAKKPAKTPAPAKADNKKSVEDTKGMKEVPYACYYVNDKYEVKLVEKGHLAPANKKLYRVSDVKKAVEDAKKEKETAVAMSTDAFSKEILTEFQKRTKAIKSAIGKIDTSFETIAFNLHWINTKQAHKAEGFPTIVEYAAEAFGYQKTTCYSLIAVVDRFAKRNEKGEMLESFEDRVKGYSVSKLSLMVNLTDSDIDSLKPTMSVKDIKKFVKGLEGKALPALSEGDGELDEDEAAEENEENIVDSTVTDISNILIKMIGKEGYEKSSDKIHSYISRVLKKHPDAVIEVSYTLPAKQEEKA